jgi:hypothetical protein
VGDIETLKADLIEQGCTIKSCKALDEFEPVGLDSVLTEEERQALRIGSQSPEHATLLLPKGSNGEESP